MFSEFFEKTAGDVIEATFKRLEPNLWDKAKARAKHIGRVAKNNKWAAIPAGAAGYLAVQSYRDHHEKRANHTEPVQVRGDTFYRNHYNLTNDKAKKHHKKELVSQARRVGIPGAFLGGILGADVRLFKSVPAAGRGASGKAIAKYVGKGAAKGAIIGGLSAAALGDIAARAQAKRHEKAKKGYVDYRDPVTAHQKLKEYK